MLPGHAGLATLLQDRQAQPPSLLKGTPDFMPPGGCGAVATVLMVLQCGGVFSDCMRAVLAARQGGSCVCALAAVPLWPVSPAPLVCWLPCCSLCPLAAEMFTQGGVHCAQDVYGLGIIREPACCLCH